MPRPANAKAVAFLAAAAVALVAATAVPLAPGASAQSFADLNAALNAQAAAVPAQPVDVWLRVEREAPGGADPAYIRWSSVEGFEPATYRGQERNGSTSIRCYRGFGVFAFRPMDEFVPEVLDAVRAALDSGQRLVVVPVNGGALPPTDTVPGPGAGAGAGEPR